MRIGLFAGTFDPVHNGHIAFAQAARDACRLDKVVFLPELQPRAKSNVTDIHHRLEMLKLVCKDIAYFDVVVLDDRQFTVINSLPKLQHMFGTNITLLCGSDVAQSIPYWPHVAQLRRSVSFAVGHRGGDGRLPLEGNVTYIVSSYAQVRATDIRRCRNALVVPQVGSYMIKHRLYSV